MITINEVQTSIVNKLKGSTVPLLLVDVHGTSRADEIRAHQWQGTKFFYPAVRVKVHTLVPENTTCSVVNITASVWVFGENPSALLINDIASEVVELFHGKGWSDDVGRYVSPQAEQLGGDRIEESGIWLSEVKLTLKASKKS